MLARLESFAKTPIGDALATAAVLVILFAGFATIVFGVIAIARGALFVFGHMG